MEDMVSAKGVVIKYETVTAAEGGTVEACNDHRIAMAAAVAAGGCRGNVVVRGSECVNKSYPDFWRDLDGLKGAEA